MTSAEPNTPNGGITEIDLGCYSSYEKAAFAVDLLSISKYGFVDQMKTMREVLDYFNLQKRDLLLGAEKYQNLGSAEMLLQVLNKDVHEVSVLIKTKLGQQLYDIFIAPSSNETTAAAADVPKIAMTTLTNASAAAQKPSVVAPKVPIPMTAALTATSRPGPGIPMRSAAVEQIPDKSIDFDKIGYLLQGLAAGRLDKTVEKPMYSLVAPSGMSDAGASKRPASETVPQDHLDKKYRQQPYGTDVAGGQMPMPRPMRPIQSTEDQYMQVPQMRPHYVPPQFQGSAPRPMRPHGVAEVSNLNIVDGWLPEPEFPRRSGQYPFLVKDEALSKMSFKLSPVATSALLPNAVDGNFKLQHAASKEKEWGCTYAKATGTSLAELRGVSQFVVGMQLCLGDVVVFSLGDGATFIKVNVWRKGLPLTQKFMKALDRVPTQV